MEALNSLKQYDRVARRYDPEGELPLREYGILISVFLTLFSGGYLYAFKKGKTHEGIPPRDILLLGVAAHKFSRVLSKDKITGVIRAPFTEHGPSTGLSEVSDHPVGTGWRKVMGSLLTCPFCIGAWIASALGFGLLFAPRLTRFISAVLAVESISDGLQVAYGKLKDV